MEYTETIRQLDNLYKLANDLERSYGDWRERNTAEALAMSNTLDRRIIELNASIGYTYWKQ